MRVRLLLPALLLLAAALVAVVPLLEAQSGPALDYQPQVFVVGGDGAGLRQVSRGGGWESHPTWSPKGNRIAFVQHGIRVFTLATGSVRRIPRSRQTGAGLGGMAAPARRARGGLRERE